MADRRSPRGRHRSPGTPAARAAAAAPPAQTDTQRRLLDAALAAFAERGFDGASTAEIASRAGVAEKTLFANFGSKERLYQATLGPAGLRLVLLPEALRTLLPVLQSEHADLRSLLRELIRNRIAFLRAHPHEARLLVGHLVARPESARGLAALFAERVAPLVTPILERFIRAGALRADVPPGALLRMVAAQVGAYALARAVFLPDAAWDDEREIELILDVTLHGLAATARQKPAGAGRRRRGV